MNASAGAVLDAPVTATWCFDDEADPGTEALLRRFQEGFAAVVPALWHFEVANLLARGERRGRINPERAAEALALLGRLTITTEAADPTTLRERILLLSREHGLTAYDAAYLDLALPHGLPLATMDAALRRAAVKAGVVLLPG